MGTWAYPNDDAKVDRLARLMAHRMDAEHKGDLFNLLGDDTLFDMIDGLPPMGDMRPLVAMALDEMVNWTVEARYFERLSAMGEPFKDVPFADLSTKPVSDGRPESAIAAVKEIVDPEANDDRFEAEPGLSPGTHAVRDLDTGKIFRFEHVYGVTIEAAPGSHAHSVFAKAPSFGP